jgi:competence protein ComEC
MAWLIAAESLRRSRARAASVALAAGFLACGAALGARAARDAAQPGLLAWQRQLTYDRAVRLAGIARGDAARAPGGIALTLDAVAADGVPVDGGVRVSIAGALAIDAASAWRDGRRIALTATLREPLDYRDPGVPSDRARLARQGIAVTGSVKSAALVDVVARGHAASEAAAALRAWVRASTAAAVGRWSPESAGVVTAILIGDRSGLDAEDERRLQEAGTYHVIAISGGNIALLTALLVLLGRVCQMPARGTAAVSIALLGFYGYAAGLAPSVSRATIAGMIYLAARAADHRGPALNAVAVAAALAAAVSPLTILDAGFVLSFGATVAIIGAASRVAPRLARARGESRGAALRRGFVDALRALGAATLCAEIALAPVGAALFGRVSAAGLLLNFIAIPLMSVIQVAGLAAVAAASVSPGSAAACGWVAHVATTALIGSASLVDVAPWLVVDLPPPAWWVVALWYAGCAGVLVFRRPRVRHVAAAGVCVAAVLMVAAPLPARRTVVPGPPPGWTRLVFLDVGQGDATLLQPAGAPPLFVDAGGAAGSAFDVGRRVTLPAAWAFGVRSLSALVLTHGDPDHIGGAPALLRALSPGAVWDGVPVPLHAPLQRLREAARRAGIPWIERHAGDEATAGGAILTVLNPPPADWERQRVRNDDSIVLQVRIGDVTVLLPGDISSAVEPFVLARFQPTPIVIVKAPHHGSAGSSSPRFVEKTRPAAVVFSAGRRNPFGHPAPAVVARYKDIGAHIFCTADDGAVILDTNGRDVRVTTWNGLTQTIRAGEPRPAPPADHKDAKAQRRED